MIIKPNKKGQWYVSFTLPNGERKRKTFPKGTLKRDALSFVSESMKLDKASISVNMKNNLSNLSFSDLADIYIPYLSKTSSKDNVSYVKRAAKYWGDRKIDSITKEMVGDWVSSLFDSDKNYKIATVEHYFSAFRTVLNYSVKKEIISHNPFSKVEFRKEFKNKTKRNTVISRDEYEEFEKLFADCKPQIQHLLTAIWHSGMRINEALNLKWSRVKMSRSIIILNPDEVKEKKQRVMIIEPEFLKLLTLLKSKKHGEYVFSFDGVSKISYGIWRFQWLKRIKSTEFVGMKTHDLRHCFATIRYQEGWTKEEIKLQLGHTTESMFVTYNTTGIQDLQKAAGFHSEKRDIIDNDVLLLMRKIRDNNIPIGTLQALIREFR